MDARITKYTRSGDGKYITVGGEADGWKFEVDYLYAEQAKVTAEHQARLVALEPDDDDSIDEALDVALAGIHIGTEQGLIDLVEKLRDEHRLSLEQIAVEAGVRSAELLGGWFRRTAWGARTPSGQGLKSSSGGGTSVGAEEHKRRPTSPAMAQPTSRIQRRRGGREQSQIAAHQLSSFLGGFSSSAAYGSTTRPARPFSSMLWFSAGTGRFTRLLSG